MITGWLLKMVLAFVLVGFLIVEAGSPLVTRAQLDGVAHDAADSAALELLDNRDIGRACAIATDIATDENAFVKECVVGQGGLTVTVEREARSILLKKVDQLKSWYDVEVTATATRGRS